MSAEDIARRVGDVETRLRTVERKVDMMEEQVKSMASDVDGAKTSADEHRRRLDHVEDAIHGWRETRDDVMALRATVRTFGIVGMIIAPAIFALVAFLVRAAFGH